MTSKEQTNGARFVGATFSGCTIEREGQFPSVQALGASYLKRWILQVTTLRSETIDITGSQCFLGVRGGDFEAALIVNGQIAVYHWCDCAGSVGQNLVRSVATSTLASVQRFRKSVESEIPPQSTLASHFSEILLLLETGQYLLVLEDIPSDSYVVEIALAEIPLLEVTNFYPGFGAMVATQFEPSMSSKRVEEYVQAIEAGIRPTVITLSSKGAWSEFILDGHHKLKAYRASNVQIRRLAITRLDSPQLPLEQAMSFLPKEGPLRGHLRSHRPPGTSET
ncbi:hypothetical protein FNU76_23515 [Chitinimonas arctica]|uniref:ParB/Sulfiredoxin domain-containing protein n=1 Tax=Chitinimonas arctica TaxID=2594795 RepID=A0A516SLQ9_9NEIS|nr:hypothetical protein [Chitinimonas arctica]QDQ29079.1 hypothetical protein FNU76_23515 [Chitinimonas arctica]